MWKGFEVVGVDLVVGALKASHKGHDKKQNSVVNTSTKGVKGQQIPAIFKNGVEVGYLEKNFWNLIRDGVAEI